MISKKVFKRKNELKQFIYYVGCENNICKVYPIYIKQSGFIRHDVFIAVVVIENAVLPVRLQQLFVTLRAAEHSVIIKENNAKRWLGKPDAV